MAHTILVEVLSEVTCGPDCSLKAGRHYNHCERAAVQAIDVAVILLRELPTSEVDAAKAAVIEAAIHEASERQDHVTVEFAEAVRALRAARERETKR